MQTGLLTGDRIDCTLELHIRLQPNSVAEVKGVPTGSVLPSLGLPLPAVESGPVALIGSAWARAAALKGIDVAETVLPWLRQRFSRVVGLDQEASFQLEFSDDVAAALDVVIKPNGLYLDREFYGQEVGAWTANGTWTGKNRPRHDARQDLPPPTLHGGAPGFITEAPAMRALRRRTLGVVARAGQAAMDAWSGSRVRPMNARQPPRATAHFLGQLSHVQRAEGVRRIRRAGLPFFGGITGVPARINGLNGRRWAEPDEAARRALYAGLANENLTSRPMPRWAYRSSLAHAKAVVSLVGHGEICYRMAEAWAARRILVCQNISHAHTAFPFRNGRNVIFCQPDLSDLTDILEDIEINFHNYLAVAEQGHADWVDWAAQAEQQLLAQFAPVLKQS